MRDKFLTGRMAALAAGFVVGFFIVLNSLFSDVFTWQERLYSFVLVILAYGLLGLIFGMISPSLSWKWGLWLAAPAVLLVIFYALTDGFRPFLYTFYILLTLICACGGAFLGTGLRLKKKIS
jgi:MFS family permease